MMFGGMQRTRALEGVEMKRAGGEQASNERAAVEGSRGRADGRRGERESVVPCSETAEHRKTAYLPSGTLKSP